MRKPTDIQADINARREALDRAALTRARGPQGRTRVRPAGGIAEQARAFHITEATMLDEENPTSDLSSTTALRAQVCDAGQFGEIKIALKFPRRIRAQGAFHIGCTAGGYCAVTTWAPSYGSTDVSLRAYAQARPITSFNGLSVATLNWNNRGDLSLGDTIGSSLIAQCYATNVVEYSAGILASGIENNFYSFDQPYCALRYQCGGGVEMEGLLLELALGWNNLWYYTPGRIEGILDISRGDTGNAWTFFGFHNPA